MNEIELIEKLYEDNKHFMLENVKLEEKIKHYDTLLEYNVNKIYKDSKYILDGCIKELDKNPYYDQNNYYCREMINNLRTILKDENLVKEKFDYLISKYRNEVILNEE